MGEAKAREVEFNTGVEKGLKIARKEGREKAEDMTKALMVCDRLFEQIEGDFTDPRSTCKAGRELISAIISLHWGEK